MENTVCSAYSGLVPMSPKTTPSAASDQSAGRAVRRVLRRLLRGRDGGVRVRDPRRRRAAPGNLVVAHGSSVHPPRPRLQRRPDSVSLSRGRAGAARPRAPARRGVRRPRARPSRRLAVPAAPHPLVAADGDLGGVPGRDVGRRPADQPDRLIRHRRGTGRPGPPRGSPGRTCSGASPSRSTSSTRASEVVPGAVAEAVPEPEARLRRALAACPRYPTNVPSS